MSEVFHKQVGKFIASKEIDNLKNNWKKTGIKTQSIFIGADIILEQLKKSGATGLRIELGLNDTGDFAPIFWAADDKGRKIMSSSGKDGDPNDSDGANASIPCPPTC